MLGLLIALANLKQLFHNKNISESLNPSSRHYADKARLAGTPAIFVSSPVSPEQRLLCLRGKNETL
jgi:hypothetical protein